MRKFLSVAILLATGFLIGEKGEAGPPNLVVIMADDLGYHSGVIGKWHLGAHDSLHPLSRGFDEFTSNLDPGLKGDGDQTQRAHAYVHYLEEALRPPNIVGAHWFQYREQAVTGRKDGENYQIGFVDITDSPSPEMVAAARSVGMRMCGLRAGE